MENDIYCGAIVLRHCLNDFLLRAGGHIGYGIRPSARKKGAGHVGSGEQFSRAPARSSGLSRVLVTCDDDNIGSARTIETNGGVLENVADTELARMRRYWIAL